LLEEKPATVALTITTDNDKLAMLLEPQAPSSTERLKTVKTLVQKGLQVSVRIDPIIPFVNEDHVELVAKIASLGVKHVTASTYKPRNRDWQRFAAAMPEDADKLRMLYWVKGERANGCVLLPKDLRFKLLSNLKTLVLQNGMQFAVCRERLSHLNTAACDGSWLLQPKSAR
jgi:DNA repair photolyase